MVLDAPQFLFERASYTRFSVSFRGAIVSRLTNGTEPRKGGHTTSLYCQICLSFLCQLVVCLSLSVSLGRILHSRVFFNKPHAKARTTLDEQRRSNRCVGVSLCGQLAVARAGRLPADSNDALDQLTSRADKRGSSTSTCTIAGQRTTKPIKGRRVTLRVTITIALKALALQVHISSFVREHFSESPEGFRKDSEDIQQYNSSTESSDQPRKINY